MMKNSEIRNFENDLINVINAYNFPYDFKRIVLEKLAMQCEREADKAILEEPITEKGELEDGTELAEGT